MTLPLTGPARLADSVAAELERRILEGSLKPGDRLPAERALAVELGVSRPSLREAIQKLVSKGLLNTRHGGGSQVTDRLEAHFADPWQDMVKSHPHLHRDLLEFRQMLEGEAARLAADRATDADIRRLDLLHAKLEAVYAGADLSACIDADVAFHQAVAEATHNAMFGHLTSSLMRVIHGHVSSNLAHLRQRPPRWEQVKTQHRAIWLAVREHRPQDAARAARAHIEFVRRSIEEAAHDEERRSSARRRSGEPRD